MARRLRVFTAVHAGDTPAAYEQRALGVIRYAIFQSKMFRWTGAGAVHYVMFAGSTILLAANIDIVTGGLLHAIVGWPLGGVLWVLLLGVQNVIAVAVLATLVWLFGRRLIARPARLSLDRAGLLVLVMIGLVVGTEFVAQVFEIAAYGEIPGAIVNNVLAAPLRTLGATITEAGFALFWWAHVVVLAAFLLFIPTNKHFHIYTSFANIWFRKLAPRGELPRMDLEDEQATFGLRTLGDLGWKDVLDGYTCTECGRCQEACPAWNTGKSLNPKFLIMGIRGMSESAERTVDLIPNSPLLRDTSGPASSTLAAAALSQPIVDTAIPYDAVWDCVTCGACVEACPVLIEHVDKIVGLRRNLVLEDARFPPELTPAFRAMEAQANPWGQPASARMDWTKPLSFEVRTVKDVAAAGELDRLEVLYWVGCAAAFDSRNQKVARAVATCLHAAGVDFAVLGQEESCTGDPARRLGNDYVFQMLAKGAIETLDSYRMGERTIVTACPHCFNTIGNEYGQLGGNFRIVHHSQYLADLVSSGRLATLPEDASSSTGDHRPGSITVHDSCYLARYNGVIGETRAVIGAVPGIELREMEKSGRNTFCCGAGGGRMWMEEKRGTRINNERTSQVLATGADAVATACPFCLVMMRDGVADAGARGDGVQVQDIAEILAAGLPARATNGRSLPMVR